MFWLMPDTSVHKTPESEQTPEHWLIQEVVAAAAGICKLNLGVLGGTRLRTMPPAWCTPLICRAYFGGKQRKLFDCSKQAGEC